MREDAFTRLPSALCMGDCSVLGRGEQGSPTEEQLEVFWVRVCYSSTRSPQGGRLASEGGGAAAPRKAAASIHSLKSSHTSNRADRLPEISMQPRVVLTLLVVTASSTQWMRDFFRL